MGLQIFDIMSLVIIFIICVNWIVILTLHFRNTKFRSPPGSLIAWDIAATLSNHVKKLYSIIKASVSGLTATDCIVIPVIGYYSGCLIFLYLFWLCVEIYNSVKNPFDNKYNKRVIVYTILNHMIAILVGLGTLFF